MPPKKQSQWREVRGDNEEPAVKRGPVISGCFIVLITEGISVEQNRNIDQLEHIKKKRLWQV